MTRVTAVLAHSSGELLLLGTEGGHVFIVEVPGFRELEERNISLDQVASRWATSTCVMWSSDPTRDVSAPSNLQSMCIRPSTKPTWDPERDFILSMG